MFSPDELPTVSMRDVCRSPREVLRRILRGERLIVCRHGHPIATLQPLNGCVTQPFEAQQYDLVGSPLGDLDREIAKLRPVEKDLLMNAVRADRLHPVNVRSRDFSGAMRAVRNWQLRGLARKSKRGLIITGRALMLREVLLEKAGRRDELYE